MKCFSARDTDDVYQIIRYVEDAFMFPLRPLYDRKTNVSLSVCSDTQSLTDTVSRNFGSYLLIRLGRRIFRVFTQYKTRTMHTDKLSLFQVFLEFHDSN